MTSPPDKLFREGLGQYQKKAPPSAWARIENNLDRKRNLSPWMKIAAGLFLVIAASMLIWQEDKTGPSLSQQSPVGSGQIEEDSLKSLQLNSIVERSRNKQTLVESKNLPVVERSRNEPLSGSPQSPASSLQSDDTLDNPHLTEVSKTDEIMTESAPIAQVEMSKEMSDQMVPVEPDRANITYTAEQVNAKFLKKEFPPEATPEKKNTSGLQKVVAVALDLKNEESLVGELREKKNEWLSINTSTKKREFNK